MADGKHAIFVWSLGRPEVLCAVADLAFVRHVHVRDLRFSFAPLRASGRSLWLPKLRAASFHRRPGKSRLPQRHSARQAGLALVLAAWHDRPARFLLGSVE